MSENKILLVYKKELLEVIRNSKTMFMMVFIPAILFPSLFIGLGYLTGIELEKTEKSKSNIVIINANEAFKLVNSLKNEKIFNIQYESNPDSALESGDIQLIIQIPAKYNKNINNEIPVTIKVLYDKANVKSTHAHGRFIQFFNNFKKDFYKNELTKKGISASFLNILNMESTNTASSKKMGAFIVGSLFPFLILILTFSGAMYTALSITVGEKERQTIETILVSAIRRKEIVLGKFLTVFTTSFLSAFLGLFSLFLTFQTGIGAIAIDMNTPLSISIFSILYILLLILPVAGIFSAILITLGCLSRTQKEGEMYATIFLMIIIALSITSLIKGFEPELKLFLIPVMNTTLIQKELLMSNFNILHILLTFISTTFIAIASLYTATKLFLREEILLRS